ncbi:hypothetical protein ACSFXN_18115 [Planococcus sp. 1R117A]|uniref:hypothetical protein n=1 Tax=Planococcus sp. 1R117A TaxID=3447020 RepID=UPI003EDB8F64
MSYLLRSSTGVVLVEENTEKIFQTQGEAEEHLSLLRLNTTEEWFIIEVKED